MSDSQLTKEEALKLITAVVDGEVDERTRAAFLKFIEGDAEVRREYHSVKRVKKIVAERCPSYKAPDRLKVRIREFLYEQTEHPDNFAAGNEEQLPTVDIPSQILPKQEGKEGENDDNNFFTPSSKWIYAAAASFLLLTLLWGLFSSNTTSNPEAENAIYKVEQLVYEHFENNNGQLVPPTITTASISDAETMISSNYDMSLTVPSLKNAEFKGVAYSEFVPDFKVPLLEYYLPEEDQFIYIFAFPMNRFQQFGKLSRNEDAIKNCVKPSDFHIEDVKGKHVVSWQWDDTWYAAISNHNGHTLASLVEPLQYDIEGSN